MLASTLLAVVFVPAFFVMQRLDEWLGKKKPPRGSRPATLPSIEPTEIAPSD
jgi:hypothetical protein